MEFGFNRSQLPLTFTYTFRRMHWRIRDVTTVRAVHV